MVETCWDCDQPEDECVCVEPDECFVCGADLEPWKLGRLCRECEIDEL